MTDALYFVPRTGEIILSNGKKRVLVKGVQSLADDIANDSAATAYGVRPVHEMTAGERAEHRMPDAPPDVDESIKIEPREDKSSSPAKPAVAAPDASPPVVAVSNGATLSDAGSGKAPA